MAKPLHRELLRQFITQVTSGALQPGDMLPSEADLVSAHGVSRGVVRETIRALEERGLITVTHGVGQRVSRPELWRVDHPDVLAVLLDGPERDSVRAETNEHLEFLLTTAVRAACDRRGRGEVTKMREAVGAMEQASAAAVVSSQRYCEGLEAYFLALIATAENRVHKGFATPFLRVLPLVPPPLDNATQVRDKLLPLYRDLAAHVGARDSEAALERLRELLAAEARAGRDTHPAIRSPSRPGAGAARLSAV